MNSRTLAAAAFVAAVGFSPALAVAQGSAYFTPVITCFGSTENTITLQVCAGTSAPGNTAAAPAGFSIQWETCDALAAGPDGTLNTADDGQWYSSDDPRLCKASFSGNANNSNWNLGAGACINVVIGGLNDADPGVSFTCNEALTCDTCYVFRAFVHASKRVKRSGFTADLSCTTGACQPTGFNDGDFCTKSQGFFSSGNASRDLMIGCFGGDPTGVACTSVANVPLVTIGGGTYTYTWATTGICVDVQPGPNVFLMDSGLASLRTAIGGGGAAGFFTANGTNATGMGTGGGLASQTAALTLNINLSGATCSGFASIPSGGYGAAALCNWDAGETFRIDGTPISAETAAALNGETVADVLAAVNAYLGGNGAVAVPYGLANAGALNELVSALNLTFHDPVGTAGCGDMSAFAESHLCH